MQQYRCVWSISDISCVCGCFLLIFAAPCEAPRKAGAPRREHAFSGWCFRGTFARGVVIFMAVRIVLCFGCVCVFLCTPPSYLNLWLCDNSFAWAVIHILFPLHTASLSYSLCIHTSPMPPLAVHGFPGLTQPPNPWPHLPSPTLSEHLLTSLSLPLPPPASPAFGLVWPYLTHHGMSQAALCWASSFDAVWISPTLTYCQAESTIDSRSLSSNIIFQ